MAINTCPGNCYPAYYQNAGSPGACYYFGLELLLSGSEILLVAQVIKEGNT